MIAHCSLLIAHCSLLIAHCSLLIAHCSLLTAHCSLLLIHNIYHPSDPHFKTFKGNYFSFHGACDLLLIRSKEILDGSETEIAVHVRTTRVDSKHGSYSYISSAAVLIGKDVLEVPGDGTLIMNGQVLFRYQDLNDTNRATLHSFAGYQLMRSSRGAKGRIAVFDLILEDDGLLGKEIQLRCNTKTGMVFVDVKGTFAESEGLLGGPPGDGKQGLFSRDGLDMSVAGGDYNTYAQSWQILDTEPMLFQKKRRVPQFPMGCIYEATTPLTKKEKRRHHRRRRRLLVTEKQDDTSVTAGEELQRLQEAKAACSNSVGKMNQFCVDDVMATGDTDLAHDPFYAQ